ncbi:alpha/beta fold hydrolase [Roseateles koreensis]|uniref:Alpha/beta hydrolase n=1 Tax=Roseateles koreensis TaxID=2987526 RepID=A0ABT5KSI5_9BURK|nr:alpha/beta hydrolase [Roseateles koreensis]MDC8785380.1 alpha/beta hydrolase [Roseateles koreensis]
MSRSMIIEGTEVWIDDTRCPPGAPALVMIHGWPDTYRVWDAQVEFFRDHYRCIRFTLPGFDASQAPQGHSLESLMALFKAIVTAVSPDAPIVLMLHDWGCMFGYQFAMQQPQKISRLVGVDIGDASSAAYLHSLKPKVKLMIAAYQLWLVSAWRLRDWFGGRLSLRMTRWIAQALRCPAPAEQIGIGMNYPYDMQWTGSYGSLRGLLPMNPPCPMFFAYGRKKPFMFHSQSWLQDMSEAPQHAVQGFDTDHWVMVRQPAAFNRAVQDWLATPTAWPTPAAPMTPPNARKNSPLN